MDVKLLHNYIVLNGLILKYVKAFSKIFGMFNKFKVAILKVFPRPVN